MVLEGRKLSAEVGEAAELLATVVGQDLEETEDGTYRIARGVAKGSGDLDCGSGGTPRSQDRV